MITVLLEALQKEFDIIQSELESFIGLQVDWQMDQFSYIKKNMHQIFNLSESSVFLCCDNSKSPVLQSNKNLINFSIEGIGSLMYLSISAKPDLTFAVNNAARYMENPSKQNWHDAKGIFKYLKGMVHYGLLP